MTNRSRSSLNSGLDILECLVAHRRPMTLTGIATALRISKSNVHQLLATLSRRRLIERLPDLTYRVGIKAWEIGSRARLLEIGRIGLPHLADLAREVSGGADIGFLDGAHMVCIQLIECPQPIRVHARGARIGDRNPAHVTSTGLVLLADLGDEEVMARLPEKLEKVAPGTIDDRGVLLEELRRIRARGHAVYHGGWRAGVSGVSVPIRGRDGRAVAGLCVPAPSERVTPVWIDAIVPVLHETAARIEHDLAAGAETAGSRPPVPGVRRRSARP